MKDENNSTQPHKKRTDRQNRSLHKYCTEVADLLNEHGIAVSVVYKNIEANHTMETIKELFRAFARAKYGKKSTTEMTTREVTDVYEEVNRHLAQFGVHVAWPSQEFNTLQ